MGTTERAEEEIPLPFYGKRWPGKRERRLKKAPLLSWPFDLLLTGYMGGKMMVTVVPCP